MHWAMLLDIVYLTGGRKSTQSPKIRENKRYLMSHTTFFGGWAGGLNQYEIPHLFLRFANFWEDSLYGIPQYKELCRVICWIEKTLYFCRQWTFLWCRALLWPRDNSDNLWDSSLLGDRLDCTELCTGGCAHLPHHGSKYPRTISI